jgi:DNA helicase-2/ATP-dependent DNA helicase PcrA
LTLGTTIDGGIDEYEDESEYAPSGCVSFLTIHQSKGLEFPVVLVGSMESGPRKSYTPLDETLAEGYLHRPVFEPFEMMKYFDFWRLFYTAFSRAQNVLALTCQENRGKGTKVPSKYFLSLYDSLPSWRSPAFRPHLLTLAQVKEVDLKREYSFTSHIALYENCAEQYRFFKELEFAPVRTGPVLFGTVVHQTIEDIHKAVLRGQVNLLSEEQVAAWFDTNYAFLTKRERVYLTPQQKRIALTDVLRYYRRHNGNWEGIKEAEVDVSLVKNGYILAGTVDLIEGDDNTVEIIDFKSERKPDINSPEDRERIERYRRQLEVYAHIVEERTGIEVSKTHLYYMREEEGVPTISFDKNSRSIERTVAKLDAVVDRIEEKDFRIPERPARLCKECDMRAYCDAKTWKFRGNV